MSLELSDRRYTYALNLSCDTPLCSEREQISGKTQQGCLRGAETGGWTISPNRLSARCPTCTKRMMEASDGKS